MGIKDVVSVQEYKDLLDSDSSLERAFAHAIITLGSDLPEPEPEYSDWHPDRNWRFDYAFVDYKVGIELDGGAHGRLIKCHNCQQHVRAVKKDGSIGKRLRIAGWHAHPARFQSDKEKFNEAQRLGWIVLRFTNDDVVGDPFSMIQYIRGVLDSRRLAMPLIEPLTKRELEVLHFIAAGFTTKEIASRLQISNNTVRSLAQKISEKLNTHSRAASVARAACWGLLNFDKIPWANDPFDFVADES